MIRIDDPANLGAALLQLRTMLQLGRRELSRDIAALTGRNARAVNSQLWGWEHGDYAPNPTSMGPLLKALGWQLALVPVIEDAPQEAPGSTESAEPPVPGVLGCAGADLEALRASEAVSGGAPSLADTIIEVGPFAPGEEMGGLGMALHRSADLNELRDELIAGRKAVELLGYALHLRMHGERAPGGNETWREFDQRAETLLRALSGHPDAFAVQLPNPTCIDVTGNDQTPRSEWACGPECPKEA